MWTCLPIRGLCIDNMGSLFVLQPRPMNHMPALLAVFLFPFSSMTLRLIQPVNNILEFLLTVR